MKLHIIDPNYLFNHKYFRFVKIIGGVYILILLRYTNYSSGNPFLEYENEIQIASGLFIFFIFLSISLNSFLYLKIGELHINYDSITLLKNGWTKTINLNKVKSIRIEEVHGKEYVLKIDNIKVSIELNTRELNKLKTLKTVVKIDFPKTSIIYKLKIEYNVFQIKIKRL